MTENTDGRVLMICENCKYEEFETEENLAFLRKRPHVHESAEDDTMLFPFCLGNMYRKKFISFNQKIIHRLLDFHLLFL